MHYSHTFERSSPHLCKTNAGQELKSEAITVQVCISSGGLEKTLRHVATKIFRNDRARSVPLFMFHGLRCSSTAMRFSAPPRGDRVRLDAGPFHVTTDVPSSPSSEATNPLDLDFVAGQDVCFLLPSCVVAAS